MSKFDDLKNPDDTPFLGIDSSVFYEPEKSQDELNFIKERKLLRRKELKSRVTYKQWQSYIKEHPEIKVQKNNKENYKYPKTIENKLFELLQENNFINNDVDDNSLYKWNKSNALLGYLANKILDVLKSKPQYKYSAIENYIKRPSKTRLDKSFFQQPEPLDYKVINNIIDKLKDL